MEREIKFRVWNKIIKEMWSWEKIQDGCFSIFNQSTNDIWLQFTGLLDKNGKEIYEGDIIKYKYNDELSPVTYGHTTCECCGWCYGFSTENEKNRFDDPNDCEVVGNIYENPELIK